MNRRIYNLNNKIKRCNICSVSCLSSNPVCGYGNLKSEIMLLGEAPGKDEVDQKKPFVGNAGMFLDVVLESFRIDKNKIYITNVVKHRPHVKDINRKPNEEEINNCIFYLMQEIKIVNPKIIITLGKVAENTLFWKGKDNPESCIKRGKIYRFNDVSILSTYHPSYCQRQGGVGNLKLFHEVLMHFNVVLNFAAEIGIDIDKYRRN